MALTERSRSALYRGLSDTINDEEAVGEMLSYFPARDVEEPATKDFVRAELASVRSDMAAMEQRLVAHVHHEVRASMQWTLGVMVSLFGLLIAALAAFG